MDQGDANRNTTVGELLDFLDRTNKALAESDRSDLVDKGYVMITPDPPFLHLRFGRPKVMIGEETVEKALSFDPLFTNG